MKNKIIGICVLFILTKNTVAQSKIIDSLEKLTQIQKDSQLASTYNELTWQYRTIDKEKAIMYGNKAIELATTLNYPKSIAQAYNDLGIIFYDKENYDTAILLYNKAIEIRRKLKDELGIAKLFNKIGIIFQKQGVFDKALENQFAALELFKKCKNDFGISYTLNNIGILNQNLGRYPEAIEYHTQSLSIKEKINDKIGVAGSLVNIANIYLITEDFVKAETSYSKAIKIARELGDKEYLSNALNNLGSLYKKTNQYEKSISCINESLQLRIALKDTKGTVSCYSNLGDIYLEKKDFKKADSIFTKAISIGSNAVNCLPELNKIYLSYANLFEKNGNPLKALLFYKLYAATKDSLYTDKVGTKFAELETKYKTLEQEKKIQNQKFEISKRNYWIIAITTLLILGSLITYLIYRRYQLKQQSKLQAEVLHQQDLATKAILFAEENERKRIASDLHDSIGQTMSAAKMNLSALQNELPLINNEQKISLQKIIELVDDSCKEVRYVSHNMMPNALLKVGLANAIREFTHRIDKNIIKIDLYTEGINDKLDNNIETVLYRVIQECVNNVIKHSNANHLDIAIIKDSDGLSITIEDNGKGFDTSDKQKFDGIGMTNIQSRVAYLKGAVEWQSTIGNGTLVAIHIPLKNN